MWRGRILKTLYEANSIIKNILNHAHTRSAWVLCERTREQNVSKDLGEAELQYFFLYARIDMNNLF